MAFWMIQDEDHIVKHTAPMDLQCLATIYTNKYFIKIFIILVLILENFYAKELCYQQKNLCRT